MSNNLPQFTDQELERRLPVWEAMSELFRDTELDEHDHQMIASALSASGYTTDELDTIMREEVAPAFHNNLLGIGEWKGWSRDAVRDIVLAKLAQRSWYEQIPFIRHQIRNVSMAMVQDTWSTVRTMLHAR